MGTRATILSARTYFPKPRETMRSDSTFMPALGLLLFLHCFEPQHRAPGVEHALGGLLVFIVRVVPKRSQYAELAHILEDPNAVLGCQRRRKPLLVVAGGVENVAFHLASDPCFRRSISRQLASWYTRVLSRHGSAGPDQCEHRRRSDDHLRGDAPLGIDEHR